MPSGVTITADDTEYVYVSGNLLEVIRPAYDLGDKEYTILLYVNSGNVTLSVELSGVVKRSYGSGSKADPYIIDSVGTLENMVANANSNKYWALKSDIDLSQKYNSSTGNSWIGTIAIYNESTGKTSYQSFKGNFNGNNHTISGLYINSTDSYQGLFGRVDSCTIQNLNIVDAYVKAGLYSGILLGQTNNNTTVNISNISISGTIETSLESRDSAIGGMIGSVDARTATGKNTNITINNCYVDTDVLGGRYVGGAFGQVKLSDRTTSIKISNIEVHGSVKGVQGSGSLIGSIERTTVNGATASGDEKYLTINNIVTYNTVSANLNPNVADSYQSNCGIVGLITNSNATLPVVFENVIIYQLGSYESFPEGIRASFIGRSDDMTTVSTSDCYVNGTPFGYNNNYVQADGNKVIYGTKLPDNLTFDSYTTMGFDSNVWVMGTNGIELKSFVEEDVRGA